ncbi:ATP-binding protein [Sulfuricaulis sp.]|jgi:hypothetical protein|uniref:ATP-binding protein n=1 Tax=Sulfuricaulis sp. TaxID=2003553 RepID=UPI00355A58C6
MDIPIADVMIHIDEALPRDALMKLEYTVREDECVISASVPAGKEHMMLVAYNPDCTSATDILARVNKQGIHAELVGL